MSESYGLLYKNHPDFDDLLYIHAVEEGHSPSSTHLEYETQLDTQLLADRHVNPKISDIYSLFKKWRKFNLGIRTGKRMFT